MTFENLKLIEPLLRALKTEGYTIPTPIQAQAIPILLERKDLLGCAQTGTGKTAAFALPILQNLHEDELYVKGPEGIKTLILTPTRELAIQIGESFTAYGRHLRLRHTVIFGGVSQHSQTTALRNGVDILIATPGRLLDLMNQRFVKLDNIKMFVLDEADRMLDMGFIHDVKKIIARIPAKRQTLFFSATMPAEIAKLANTILTNPVKVEVTPVSSTANTIQQSLYFVDKKDKRKLLKHILDDHTIGTALVFTRTKHGADRVARDLNDSGIRAEAIHGDKSQGSRQRALSNFKARKTRILVATDIAARGIDVDELTHVINFELPNVPETYVHRIGRTGRAGASGISLSFCDEEEKEYLQDIHKLIAKTIPVVEDHPYPLQRDGMPKIVPSVQPGRQRQGNKQQRPDGRRQNSRNGGQSTSGSRSPRQVTATTVPSEGAGNVAENTSETGAAEGNGRNGRRRGNRRNRGRNKQGEGQGQGQPQAHQAQVRPEGQSQQNSQPRQPRAPRPEKQRTPRTEQQRSAPRKDAPRGEDGFEKLDWGDDLKWGSERMDLD
ncbi:DEAD/DEAH box helicase [Parachryseolinea silvisoli]|uniref:DEAD/DEAH box helicase n=1 Tax=Parachryseolinea silvisoli TaxID=2873601 RepID=UPI002265ECB8|nr:DEAD/DEAH box helicase [Parachryseolinea silvisoli]MCD9015398.1 DEAD/DEAH box helicase [Parachryseolinea silvisoli]